MRAIRFDSYGDEDVLYVAEVDKPRPQGGEVLVRVRTAGVSTGEVGIRSGAMAKMAPAHFPEGQGTELAGVVAEVGAGVEGVAVGDAVIGWSDVRGAQADFAVLPTDNCLPKPERVDWDTAAATPSAGATAVAVLGALEPAAGETMVVAGASGGVGLVTTQLAVQTGARVIATASERNHAFLRELRAEPVSYGEGVEQRIRAAAPDGVDAFADCHGEGNVDLALELRVPTRRINTIKDFPAAAKVGAQTQGMYQLDSLRDALQPIVTQVADGQIQLPVKATFPLAEVRDAYRRLTQPGGVGRVVLHISFDGE